MNMTRLPHRRSQFEFKGMLPPGYIANKLLELLWELIIAFALATSSKAMNRQSIYNFVLQMLQVTI